MAANYWWYITVCILGGELESAEREEILYSAAEISGSIGTEVQELPNGTRMRIYYRADEEIGRWRERLLDSLKEWESVRIEDMGKIENQQWLKQSEESFPPLKIGERLVVMAPWHRGSEPSGRTAIYINPGSAFGTGYHESTQTALILFEDLLGERGAPKKVVDVGTGSGILSIASVKLGAEHSLAIDLDPGIVDEVGGNLRLNAIEPGRVDVMVGDLLHGVEGKFDLLFANILLEPNIELLPDVAHSLVPRGAAIFSGMTTKESPKFLKALRETELEVVETVEIGEWWGVRTKAPA